MPRQVILNSSDEMYNALDKLQKHLNAYSKSEVLREAVIKGLLYYGITLNEVAKRPLGRPTKNPVFDPDKWRKGEYNKKA